MTEKTRTQQGETGRGRGRRAQGLIPNRRARAEAFGKRKKTLKDKAWELSELCGVDVALVVAAPDDGGVGAAAAAAADVWESDEGAVLARYRALDPEVRARHTHRAYLEGVLGKEEAKLARVRQAGPAGLDPWNKALDGVDTAEEARQMLETIDAAIRAAEDRMRALGLAVHDEDGVVLDEIAPLDFAPMDGYPLQAPGRGVDNNGNQAMWGSDGLQAYGFQQYTTGISGAGMEGYNLLTEPEMYGGGGVHNNGRIATDAYLYQPRDAGTMQNGYGFQGARAGYFGMPAGHQMQQVLGWGAAQPDLATWSTDEPRHALLPVHYSSAGTGLNYMDTLVAHGAQGCGGRSFAMGASGDFVNTPPELSLAMGTGGCGGGNFIDVPPLAISHTISGTGDNFTNATPVQPLAMSYGGDLTMAGTCATQWQAAQQPQRAGDGQHSDVEQVLYLRDLADAQFQAAKQHQHAGNGQPPSIEQLHYLSDLADAHLHAAQQHPHAGNGEKSSITQLHYLIDQEEDMQLHLWGN